MNQNSINSNLGDYGRSPSMTYHNVMIVLCALGALSSLANSEIFSTAFFVATAFFLYKRTKVGYVLCMIYNVFLIVIGCLTALMSILFFTANDLIDEAFDFALDLADYEAIMDIGFTLFGIVCLIVGALLIVWGILTIIYYKKRKHLFVSSITNQNNVSNQVGYGESSQTFTASVANQPMNQPAKPSVCPYCGEPKNVDAIYCPHCGAKS